jgi:hypothetical protein
MPRPLGGEIYFARGSLVRERVEVRIFSFSLFST